MVDWIEGLISKYDKEKSDIPIEMEVEKPKQEKKKSTSKHVTVGEQSDIDKNLFKLSSSISSSFSKIQEKLDKINKKDRDADE